MTIYNINNLRGDTYDGAKFTLSRLGEPPLTLIGAFIIVQFKVNSKSPPLLTWIIGDGITLDLVDPLAFYFDPCIFTLEAGSYKYDVEITYADGRVSTDINGILTLTDDISQRNGGVK